MDAHSEFVFYRTYSRWNETAGRKETYAEAVERYVNYLRTTPKARLVPEKVFRKIREHMLNMDVVGSMRLFWTAGKAADASNVCAYNCSFMTMDSVVKFAELVYVLMCGCGVGFSVESKYVNQLPTIKPTEHQLEKPTIISDDKEGWADSIKYLMSNLFLGYSVTFNYSAIRPRGAVLKTMSGTASGPEPLISTHSYIRDVFRNAQGRQLKDIEVHDICCQLAEMVIVGGVRRAACISISDLDSKEMREAKIGNNFPVRRFLANNSWIAREKPDAITFMKEWASLAESGSGERGIINFSELSSDLTGVNPCGEILLKDSQFCNLSEVVVRPDDDIDSLLKKVETATWIGMIQATLVNFPYLSTKWKENAVNDPLLGVSLTGQMDNSKVLTGENLLALKAKTRKVARKAAKALEMKEPSRITCGKPSGSTSQVMHCGSGCHPWWDKYMIRRYRVSADQPITSILKASGIELIPEVGQEQYENPTIYVVEFPVEAPENAVLRHDVDALSQLEWYARMQENWCDHNQSITIYVKPDEWIRVGAWVYENWDIVRGVAFLASFDNNYKLTPIESITKEEYLLRKSKFPVIDYSELVESESKGPVACDGEKCEIKLGG